MSASSQLNIRLDPELRRRGDQVLDEHGTTPTSAVRSLWTYLATEDDLPDYMKAPSEQTGNVEQAIRSGMGLAWTSMGLSGSAASSDSTSPQPLDLSSLRDEMYNDLLDEMEGSHI